MEKTKKILNRIFIDGLSGMALGLFSTLIIGTIIAQIGTLIGGPVGSYLKAISNVAKTLTGAGIGVGVACKFKEGPLVTVSALLLVCRSIPDCTRGNHTWRPRRAAWRIRSCLRSN